jgi:hypothetical protein
MTSEQKKAAPSCWECASYTMCGFRVRFRELCEQWRFFTGLDSTRDEVIATHCTKFVRRSK